MKSDPLSSAPQGREPQPEINPPAGDVPKQFPPKDPLAEKDNGSPDRQAGGPSRSGSGEDPFVESGLPDNDPERPRQSPEEQSMR